jgi:hypothetical protein
MNKPTKSKELECLTIHEDIIQCKCDWDVKAVLQYIRFRLNLEEIDWTFSESNLVEMLHIDDSKMNRIFETLSGAAVLIFDRKESLGHGHYPTTFYKVDKANFNYYILALTLYPFSTTLKMRMDGSQNESAPLSKREWSVLIMRMVRSQNESYKKDIDKKDGKNKDMENKDSENKEEILAPVGTVPPTIPPITTLEKVVAHIIPSWVTEIEVNNRKLESETASKHVTQYTSYGDTLNKRSRVVVPEESAVTL